MWAAIPKERQRETREIDMKIQNITIAIFAAAMTSAFAASPPTPTFNTGPHSPQALGQPNQTCGSLTAPNTPGNAATAPGSAFNPGGTAGMQYAGQQPQNSRNPASVSQYDVACSHQP